MEEELLRMRIAAQSSMEPVFLRFVNLTSFDVDIFWCDYSGNFVLYKTLLGYQQLNINTYKSHPWVAFSSASKQLMHINKQFIYMPRTPIDIFEEKFPGKEFPQWRTVRLKVMITTPLSLRYLTIKSVVNCLDSKDKIPTLELPVSLQHLLKIHMHLMESYNSLNGGNSREILPTFEYSAPLD